MIGSDFVYYRNRDEIEKEGLPLPYKEVYEIISRHLWLLCTTTSVVVVVYMYMYTSICNIMDHTCIRFAKSRHPMTIIPLVPLTFLVGYQADLTWGNKMERVIGKQKYTHCVCVCVCVCVLLEESHMNEIIQHE